MAKNGKSEAEVERREWLASLDYVIRQGDEDRVRALMEALQARVHEAGMDRPLCATAPARHAPAPLRPAGDGRLQPFVNAGAR